MHYLQHREPEPRFAGMELTRWSAELARGHQSSVWQAEAEESRLGDFLVCRECERSGQESEVEIIALGQPLPDVMVRDWTVELSCGHTGTDYRVPVEFDEDPAVCGARNLDRRALCCLDRACAERNVHRVRRSGVLGKIPVRKSAPPSPGPVPRAAHELRSRLTK